MTAELVYEAQVVNKVSTVGLEIKGMDGTILFTTGRDGQGNLIRHALASGTVSLY